MILKSDIFIQNLFARNIRKIWLDSKSLRKKIKNLLLVIFLVMVVKELTQRLKLMIF